LSPAVKEAVYARMINILSGNDARLLYTRISANDRRAVLEILRETKPGFPAGTH
jgi:hypothetical protein